jgi:ATP-dependent RNA helicase DeaD
MTSKLFSELGLSPESLQAVEKLGFEQASPIQAEAIPVLMSGKDVVGQSQTGSGKTAAFGIPAIEKTDPQRREAQVLILCPTRELAVQVSEDIRKLALFKRGILTLPIYGGQSYERQFYGLQQGAQIVIGTPGRLLDHLRRGTLRLDKIKMAILDEADVMLNMGFRDDIELILQAVPKERQTVFFSATIPQPIRELIEKYSHEPQTVRIEQKSMTVPTVDQMYYEVDRRNKMELLTRLIDLYDLKLGIIFCNTKRMVDDLVDYLEAAGYQADRLHGDMTQNMRDRVMNKFRQSGLEFLVATDVAARGIDVDDVEVVFNYDLPYDPEDYVHRIGRTGRAGKSGRAISLVPYRELFQIRNIERFANVRIQRGRIPTVDEVAEARENVFLDKLRSLLASGGFPSYEHLVTQLNDEGFSSTDIVSALVHQLQSGESARHQTPKEEPEQAPRAERERRSGDRRERGPRAESRPDRFGDRRERVPRKPRRPRFEERRERPVARTDKPVIRADRPVVRVDKPVAHADKPVAEPVRAVENTPAPEAVKPAPEKTFSDAEILSSVQKPTPPAPPKQFIKPKPAAAAARSKPSRATPKGQTRLWMNLGDAQGIKPIDIVNAVAGETGLPGKVVGTVDVREKHLFVDVADEHVNGIVSKLNRALIKGHKLKVKVA